MDIVECTRKAIAVCNKREWESSQKHGGTNKKRMLLAGFKGTRVFLQA